MNSPNQIILSWENVEQLIDKLLPMFNTEFEAMVVITRGGIIPGGMLAEAMQLESVLTASVDFPAQWAIREQHKKDERFTIWPKFLQFPEAELIRDKKVLVVDDVWGSGRTISTVKYRVESAGGIPSTCVLHFNPYRSLFGGERPDYFADVTSCYVIYPWEIQRGQDRISLLEPDY
jgi:hypoxanthine phosphoribosyltransferase